MENVLNKLVAEIKSNIAHELENYLKQYRPYGNSYPHFNIELLWLVLNAYNTYQEEERDGVDYIFNINNPEDLKCCIEGGMTAKQVAWLYDQSQVNTTPFFYFGVNYEKPKPIANWEALIINLIKWLDNILPCVLAYPYSLKSYEELYKACITNYMINNQLVP